MNKLTGKEECNRGVDEYWDSYETYHLEATVNDD